MFKRLLLAVPSAILCVSCSSVQHKSFYVNAINTQEEEVVCAIVVDDMTVLDEANEPVLTPATVKLEFEAKSEGGYESLKLGVQSVKLDESGKIVEGLREGESGPYLEDSRYVYSNDAKVQLFILRRNKDYEG